MKTFRELREEAEEKWILPDYPEQVHPEDDPEGNWVTGDPPKGIDFPLDGKVRDGVENTAKILRQASKTIKKERESQKKKKKGKLKK
jgi:hypothetical protein